MRAPKKTHFVFITGGVVSSLGKGVSAAAIASLLQAHGYKVRIRKLDPYFNIDPGTMSPYEHGEVFVTEDGAETDLDLGHYERFTDVNTAKRDNITSGQIYKALIEKEREGKELLGHTIQVVPHVTDMIKEFILGNLNGEDFVFCEIGGTVGDIESLPFLEAIRQLSNDLGRARVFSIHLTLLPYLRTSNEFKTKPTQRSVKELLSAGIQPDMLICRAESTFSHKERSKIARFCNVALKAVIPAPDLDSIYQIPICYKKAGVDKILLEHFRLPPRTKEPAQQWDSILRSRQDLRRERRVLITIVGKYTKYEDSYISLVEALKHGGMANQTSVELQWVEAEELEKEKRFPDERFLTTQGILIPGGFDSRGSKGKIAVVTYARKHKIPFLGICFGMQMAVIEFAQNTLGIKDANSTEFYPSSTITPVVCLMREWLKGEELQNRSDEEDLGGSMRLGAYPCAIRKDTLAYTIFQTQAISERHRHRYEVNATLCPQFEDCGMLFSGFSPDHSLPEIVEIPSHPWFLGVQFHPEFKSRPFAPHPIFVHFVRAATRHGRLLL